MFYLNKVVSFTVVLIFGFTQFGFTPESVSASNDSCPSVTDNIADLVIDPSECNVIWNYAEETEVSVTENTDTESTKTEESTSDNTDYSGNTELEADVDYQLSESTDLEETYQTITTEQLTDYSDIKSDDLDLSLTIDYNSVLPYSDSEISENKVEFLSDNQETVISE